MATSRYNNSRMKASQARHTKPEPLVTISAHYQSLGVGVGGGGRDGDGGGGGGVTVSAHYEKLGVGGRHRGGSASVRSKYGTGPVSSASVSVEPPPAGPRKVRKWKNLFKPGKPFLTETFTCEVKAWPEGEIPPVFDNEGRINPKWQMYMYRQRMIPYKKKHPYLTSLWMFLFLLGWTLIAGSVTTGVSFLYVPPTTPAPTTPTPPPPPPTTPPPPPPPINYTGRQSFYQRVCIPYFQNITGIKKNNDCIVGPPPTEHSCKGGVCTHYLYTYETRYFGDGQISNFTVGPINYNVTEKHVPINEEVHCLTENGKLGLCGPEAKCQETGTGVDKSWYNESKWLDNCDEPNPCWQESATKIFSTDNVTRADCLKMDTGTCGKPLYRAAVVWIQHLLCDSGKDRTRKVPCSGVPLKLWVCAKCNSSVASMGFIDYKCEKEGRLLWPCAYTCTQTIEGNRINGTLKDGAACLNSTGGSNKTGYCYRGMCYHDFAVLNETTRHELNNTDHCNETKRGG